jgi:hypothetical protein
LPTFTEWRSNNPSWQFDDAREPRSTVPSNHAASIRCAESTVADALPAAILQARPNIPFNGAPSESGRDESFLKA